MDGLIHTDTKNAKFNFPTITQGYNRGDTILDFGNGLAALDANPKKISRLRLPLHDAIEFQHENNKVFCQRTQELIANTQNYDGNKTDWLAKTLDREYNRIQESMEQSLESIKKYFTKQLEQVRKYFDEFIKSYRDTDCY